MKARAWFLGCVGLIAAFLAVGCGGSAGAGVQSQADASAADSAGSAGEYVAPDARGIQTVKVAESPIPEYLELPAHIDPDPTLVVHVYPPATGRIIEMKVRPWDRVEKGQTLAVIESGDLARAVADYHKAQADNQVKQDELVRARDLYDHQAIAEKDLQQAQGDAQMAAAELVATRDQIRELGMDPDHASNRLNVVAPRGGVILDVGAAPGEYSNALAAPAPLCTIADISTVWAVGDIYEKDLAAAKAGQQAQVTLDAYPGEVWNGRVSGVSDAVDAVTRALQVRVVLENPRGELKPSLFGTIRLLRSASPGILLPSAAVIREGSGAYVFVGVGNNRYARRDVKLGRAVDGSLEIVSGINPGDTVVSEGALLLRAAPQE
ncbi:MAG: efflux RND transporter periplasmic adaptor subunit [Candidatus Acidiferrales bacterium]